jgi:hypothetical protein
MNSIVALPIAAAVPTIAPVEAAQAVDPIFAAVEAFRCAEVEFYAERNGDIPDEIGDRWSEAADAVIRTQPTTPAGLVALTSFAREMAERSNRGDAGFADRQWTPVMVAIDNATRGMSGLKPWTPPVEDNAIAADAQLIALGKQLEPLVDAYYAARRPWARALVQRNNELEERFGSPADRDYQYTPEYAAAAEELDRTGLDEAADRLHVAFEKIEMMARAIEALPCTSIEGLRAKALVAFWEVAPLCAGDTEFHFEDAYPFQHLFWAVAEVCGLNGKIAATGFEMPCTDFSEDDGEEA